MSTPPSHLIPQFFREVVLILGGVFAVRGTDDETICQVARGLERAYRRACRATSAGGQGGRSALAPHPAIAGLLRLTEAPSKVPRRRVKATPLVEELLTQGGRRGSP